ncbi:MAG TPA: hypothetical protein VK747_04370 [Blastocatellia bacterium]|nr:hypothetical protein [Blastocatellia bacterium]
MRNYIRNLIARNQETADVVVPRLPSIFEPPSVESPTALQDLQALSSEVAFPADDETLDRRTRGGRAESTMPVSESSSHRHERVAEPPSTITKPPEVTTARERVTVLKDSPPESAPSLTPPQFGSRPIEKPDRDNSVHSTRGEKIDTPVRPNDVTALDSRSSSRLPGSDEARRAQPGRRENERVLAGEKQQLQPVTTPIRTPAQEFRAERAIIESKNAESSLFPGSKQIVVQPQISRRDEYSTLANSHGAGRERLTLKTDAPPAPTINVTIGRIEVRAVQSAPAPQRPQKSTAPSMNLDEYLRRRSAGGDLV